MSRPCQRLGPGIYARLDADGQAIAQRVDLFDDRHRVTVPAHDMQHRAKDFLLHVGNLLDFRSMGCNQVSY